MQKIIIINGPNLNLVGVRETEIYGKLSFGDFLEQLQKNYPPVKIDYYQSNVEGELINQLQEVGFSYDGILLNAGGYTHTSVALADAVAAIKTPVVEIHISHPLARERERHISLLHKHCVGSIAGFGLESYRLGIEYFKNQK